MVSAKGEDDHERRAHHDPDICHVEDTRAQRANPHVQEVGDAAIEGNAIDEVADTTSHDECAGDDGPHRNVFRTKHPDEKPKQKHRDEHHEDECAPGVWQGGAEAQKGAGVLGISEAKGVSQKGLHLLALEVFTCGDLGDLIAANAEGENTSGGDDLETVHEVRGLEVGQGAHVASARVRASFLIARVDVVQRMR